MRFSSAVVCCIFLITEPIFSNQTCNNGLFIIAGALRNSGDGWRWINDKTHQPIGVQSRVDQDERGITIHYSQSACQVVSLVVTTDETLAGKSIQTGASVSRSKARIELYADGERIPAPDLVSRWGNLWVYGVMAL